MFAVQGQLQMVTELCSKQLRNNWSSVVHCDATGYIIRCFGFISCYRAFHAHPYAYWHEHALKSHAYLPSRSTGCLCWWAPAWGRGLWFSSADWPRRHGSLGTDGGPLSVSFEPPWVMCRVKHSCWSIGKGKPYLNTKTNDVLVYMRKEWKTL